MAHYGEKGPDGKVRIVHVHANGDKSRRSLVKRKNPKEKKSN